MSRRPWMLGVVGCLSVFALAAKAAQLQQRQHQLDKANSYAETVISAMEGLLQGYDTGTLSRAFSQEITQLTNYAQGVSSSGTSPHPENMVEKGNESPHTSEVNYPTENGTSVAPPPAPAPSLEVAPISGFNITPPPQADEVREEPNFTGF